MVLGITGKEVQKVVAVCSDRLFYQDGLVGEQVSQIITIQSCKYNNKAICRKPDTRSKNLENICLEH